MLFTVSGIGARQRSRHGRERVWMIDIIHVALVVSVVVILVFIFVTDLGMKLFVGLEIFWK